MSPEAQTLLWVFTFILVVSMIAYVLYPPTTEFISDHPYFANYENRNGAGEPPSLPYPYGHVIYDGNPGGSCDYKTLGSIPWCNPPLDHYANCKLRTRNNIFY